jgi:hypothetical protein
MKLIIAILVLSVICFYSIECLNFKKAYNPAAKSPPLKSDFVNGLWSRIGKRSSINNTSNTQVVANNVYDFCQSVQKNLEYVHLRTLYVYFVRCSKTRNSVAKFKSSWIRGKFKI